MVPIRTCFAFLRRLMNKRVCAIALLGVMLAGTILVTSLSTKVVTIKDKDAVITTMTLSNNPEAILEECGITTGYGDQIVFSGFQKNMAEILIERAFPVHIFADGKTTRLLMTEGTVQSALTRANVTYSEEDLINMPLGVELNDEATITLNRVSYKQYKKETVIPFTVRQKRTPLIKNGRTRVLVAGSQGKKAASYQDRLIDGEVVETTLLKESVIKKASTQTTLVGDSKAWVSPYNFSDIAPIVNHVPTRYKRVIRSGIATAYSAWDGCKTASGRYAKVGNVAVNTKVIPYGTKLFITSADGSFVYGYAIAADTGTGLRAGHIDVDLYFDTYLESCLFGKRKLNIYIL